MPIALFVFRVGGFRGERPGHFSPRRRLIMKDWEFSKLVSTQPVVLELSEGGWFAFGALISGRLDRSAVSHDPRWVGTQFWVMSVDIPIFLSTGACYSLALSVRHAGGPAFNPDRFRPTAMNITTLVQEGQPGDFKAVFESIGILRRRKLPYLPPAK